MLDIYLPSAYRGYCHQCPGEGEYREPVEYPADNIRSINESLAVKLRPKVPEHEDSCGGNAASQDVDDNQQGKSGGRIVCQETKDI